IGTSGIVREHRRRVAGFCRERGNEEQDASPLVTARRAGFEPRFARGKEAAVTARDRQRQEARIQIRLLIRRDMTEVLAIERESFEFAGSEEDCLCCLRQRNCIGMVAEEDDAIVAYMIYELHKA